MPYTSPPKPSNMVDLPSSHFHIMKEKCIDCFTISEYKWKTMLDDCSTDGDECTFWCIGLFTLAYCTGFIAAENVVNGYICCDCLKYTVVEHKLKDM